MAASDLDPRIASAFLAALGGGVNTANERAALEHLLRRFTEGPELSQSLWGEGQQQRERIIDWLRGEFRGGTGAGNAQLLAKLQQWYLEGPSGGQRGHPTYVARRLAVTETAFYMQAIDDAYDAELEAAGMIDGYEILLSPDHDHVDECDEHAANGPYETLDDTPAPPFHPFCQCRRRPIILDERQRRKPPKALRTTSRFKQGAQKAGLAVAMTAVNFAAGELLGRLLQPAVRGAFTFVDFLRHPLARPLLRVLMKQWKRRLNEVWYNVRGPVPVVHPDPFLADLPVKELAVVEREVGKAVKAGRVPGGTLTSVDIDKEFDRLVRHTLKEAIEASAEKFDELVFFPKGDQTWTLREILDQIGRVTGPVRVVKPDELATATKARRPRKPKPVTAQQLDEARPVEIRLRGARAVSAEPLGEADEVILRPGAVYQPVEVVDAEDKWVIYYRETFDWSNPNPAKPDDFEQFTSRMARPEERVTTELWNDLFPMRPQDVFDMLYDGLDVNNARLYIARRPGDLIELQVISQEFTAYRTFRIDERGRRVAHHYSFRVAASERGKGLGTTFLRNSMALYEAMGVERVDTTATSSSAGDIGAYVWGRFGFIPSRAEWDQLRQGYLRNLYRYQKPNLSPAHQRVVEQALNNRDPRSLWDIVDLPVGKTWLTAAGVSWKGSLDLKDEASMRRFYAYVNRTPAAMDLVEDEDDRDAGGPMVRAMALGAARRRRQPLALPKAETPEEMRLRRAREWAQANLSDDIEADAFAQGWVNAFASRGVDATPDTVLQRLRDALPGDLGDRLELRTAMAIDTRGALLIVGFRGLPSDVAIYLTAVGVQDRATPPSIGVAAAAFVGNDLISPALADLVELGDELGGAAVELYGSAMLAPELIRAGFMPKNLDLYTGLALVTSDDTARERSREQQRARGETNLEEPLLTEQQRLVLRNFGTAPPGVGRSYPLFVLAHTPGGMELLRLAVDAALRNGDKPEQGYEMLTPNAQQAADTIRGGQPGADPELLRRYYPDLHDQVRKLISIPQGEEKQGALAFTTETPSKFDTLTDVLAELRAAWRPATEDELRDALGRDLDGDDELEEWNDVFGMTPRQVEAWVAAHLPPDVNTGRLYLSHYFAGGPWVLEWEGGAFQMKRTIATYLDGGRWVAERVSHDLLVVGDRGNGIGKLLFQALISLYDAIGVKRIEVGAGLSVGGYAWLKFGFLPEEPYELFLGVARRMGFDLDGEVESHLDDDDEYEERAREEVEEEHRDELEARQSKLDDAAAALDALDADHEYEGEFVDPESDRFAELRDELQEALIIAERELDELWALIEDDVETRAAEMKDSDRADLYDREDELVADFLGRVIGVSMSESDLEHAPELLWNIADTYEGKQALLGLSWSGYLYLNNPHQRERLETYIHADTHWEELERIRGVVATESERRERLERRVDALRLIANDDQLGALATHLQAAMQPGPAPPGVTQLAHDLQELTPENVQPVDPETYRDLLDAAPSDVLALLRASPIWRHFTDVTATIVPGRGVTFSLGGRNGNVAESLADHVQLTIEFPVVVSSRTRPRVVVSLRAPLPPEEYAGLVADAVAVATSLAPGPVEVTLRSTPHYQRAVPGDPGALNRLMQELIRAGATLPDERDALLYVQDALRRFLTSRLAGEEHKEAAERLRRIIDTGGPLMLRRAIDIPEVAQRLHLVAGLDQHPFVFDADDRSRQTRRALLPPRTPVVYRRLEDLDAGIPPLGFGPELFPEPPPPLPPPNVLEQNLDYLDEQLADRLHGETRRRLAERLEILAPGTPLEVIAETIEGVLEDLGLQPEFGDLSVPGADPQWLYNLNLPDGGERQLEVELAIYDGWRLRVYPPSRSNTPYLSSALIELGARLARLTRHDVIIQVPRRHMLAAFRHGFAHHSSDLDTRAGSLLMRLLDGDPERLAQYGEDARDELTELVKQARDLNDANITAGARSRAFAALPGMDVWLERAIAAEGEASPDKLVTLMLAGDDVQAVAEANATPEERRDLHEMRVLRSPTSNPRAPLGNLPPTGQLDPNEYADLATLADAGLPGLEDVQQFRVALQELGVPFVVLLGDHGPLDGQQLWDQLHRQFPGVATRARDVSRVQEGFEYAATIGAEGFGIVDSASATAGAAVVFLDAGHMATYLPLLPPHGTYDPASDPTIPTGRGQVSDSLVGVMLHELGHVYAGTVVDYNDWSDPAIAARAHDLAVELSEYIRRSIALDLADRRQLLLDPARFPSGYAMDNVFQSLTGLADPGAGPHELFAEAFTMAMLDRTRMAAELPELLALVERIGQFAHDAWGVAEPFELPQPGEVSRRLAGQTLRAPRGLAGGGSGAASASLGGPLPRSLAPPRETQPPPEPDPAEAEVAGNARVSGEPPPRTGLAFEPFFTALAGQFQQHIDQSIPNYAANRTASARAIIDAFDGQARVLDVGASEGQFGNLLAEATAGRVRTVNVDPNPAMRDAWAAADPPVGTSYELAAWVEGFRDDDNDLDIPAYDAEEPVDVVHMSMVRQFVTDDADAWYGEARRQLKDDGVFIVNVKVIAGEDNRGEWAQRESQKDDYKRLSFSEDEITRKAEETLVGMHQLMLTKDQELAALRKHFKHVEVYWESYNFYGFVASDSAERVQAYLEAHARHYRPDYPPFRPAENPWGLREFRRRPRRLLHGTTIANAMRIREEGLQPKVGHLVLEVYGQDGMDDAGEELVETTFLSHGIRLSPVVSAIFHHIAAAIGKSHTQLTIDDVRQFGAIVVVEDYDPRSVYVRNPNDDLAYDLRGDIAGVEMPQQVEPRDIFTFDELLVADVLTGQRLIDFLAAHGGVWARVRTELGIPGPFGYHPRVETTEARLVPYDQLGYDVQLDIGRHVRRRYPGVFEDVDAAQWTLAADPVMVPVAAMRVADLLPAVDQSADTFNRARADILKRDLTEAEERAGVPLDTDPVLVANGQLLPTVGRAQGELVVAYSELGRELIPVVDITHLLAVDPMDMADFASGDEAVTIEPPDLPAAEPSGVRFMASRRRELVQAEAVRAIVEYVEKHTGATYSPLHNRFHEGSGYAVGYDPREGRHVKVRYDEFKRDGVAILQRFIEANRELLEDGAHFIGAWHDVETGWFYLEPSEVIYDREEAIRAGKARNQVSIYDFESGELIATFGTGDARFSLPRRLPQRVRGPFTRQDIVERGGEGVLEEALLVQFPIAALANLPAMGVDFRAEAGKLLLVHYSPHAELTEVDPEFMGTSPHAGEEMRTQFDGGELRPGYLRKSAWWVDGEPGVIERHRFGLGMHVYAAQVDEERLFRYTGGPLPTDEALKAAGYDGWYVPGRVGQARLFVKVPVTRLGVSFAPRGVELTGQTWRERVIPGQAVSRGKPPANPEVEYRDGAWQLVSHDAYVRQLLNHGIETVLAFVAGPEEELEALLTNPSVTLPVDVRFSRPTPPHVELASVIAAAQAREPDDLQAAAYRLAAERAGMTPVEERGALGPGRMVEAVAAGARVVSVTALLELARDVMGRLPERVARGFTLPLLAAVLRYQAVKVDNRYHVTDADAVEAPTEAAALISGDREDLEDIRESYPQVDFVYLRYGED